MDKAEQYRQLLWRLSSSISQPGTRFFHSAHAAGLPQRLTPFLYDRPRRWRSCQSAQMQKLATAYVDHFWTLHVTALTPAVASWTL